MASNFTFGLVDIYEITEILALLAQTFILFSLYAIISWAREDTFRI